MPSLIVHVIDKTDLSTSVKHNHPHFPRKVKAIPGKKDLNQTPFTQTLKLNGLDQKSGGYRVKGIILIIKLLPNIID